MENVINSFYRIFTILEKSTMQKSFLIVAIVAIVGAIIIYQFIPPTPVNMAAIFVLGMILSALIVKLSSSEGVSSSNEKYTGPTLTLYVGNLPYRIHEGEVRELFGKYGIVNSVRLVRDRKTGRRKGFGFVEMSDKGANKAMEHLNDFIFQERTIKVREAKTQDSDSHGNS